MAQAILTEFTVHLVPSHNSEQTQGIEPCPIWHYRDCERETYRPAQLSFTYRSKLPRRKKDVSTFSLAGLSCRNCLRVCSRAMWDRVILMFIPTCCTTNLYIAFSNLVGPIISIRFHTFGPTCVLPECTAALKRFHLGSRPFAKVL